MWLVISCEDGGAEGESEGESEGGGRLRVPPTICFTAPAWRSMHGRKRVIFCSTQRDGLGRMRRVEG